MYKQKEGNFDYAFTAFSNLFQSNQMHSANYSLALQELQAF